MIPLKENNDLKFCLFSERNGYSLSLVLIHGWLLEVNVESPNSEQWTRVASN